MSIANKVNKASNNVSKAVGSMNCTSPKVKTSEFLAGYIYKNIEFNLCIIGLSTSASINNLPKGGYSNNVIFPTEWIGDLSLFNTKSNSISRIISQVISSTFNERATISMEFYFDNDKNTLIRCDYCVKKVPERKRMTVSEIEKLLGYKIEVIDE